MNRARKLLHARANDFDNEELLATYATQLHEVNTPSPDLLPEDEQALKEEAFEDLQAMQQEILRRMTTAAESHCRMGVACPIHDGQVHGQEASELRTKLEQYINCIDVIENGRDVVENLQRILDSTDARDSLAFEEQASPVTEQPKKD